VINVIKEINHLTALVKNFAVIFIFVGLLYNIIQHPTQTPLFVCSFVAPFACHGDAGTENITTDVSRTNVVAEASYDQAGS